MKKEFEKNGKIGMTPQRKTIQPDQNPELEGDILPDMAGEQPSPPKLKVKVRAPINGKGNGDADSKKKKRSATAKTIKPIVTPVSDPISPAEQQGTNTSGKISDTLQQISSLSQSLHEENQIQDQRIWTKDAPESEPVPVSHESGEAGGPFAVHETDSHVGGHAHDAEFEFPPEPVTVEPVSRGYIIPGIDSFGTHVSEPIPSKQDEPPIVSIETENQPMDLIDDLKDEPPVQPVALPTNEVQEMNSGGTEIFSLPRMDAQGEKSSVPSEEVPVLAKDASETVDTVQPLLPQEPVEPADGKKEEAPAPVEAVEPVAQTIGLKKTDQTVLSDHSPTDWVALWKKMIASGWFVAVIGIVALAGGAALGAWRAYHWYDAHNTFKTEAADLKKQIGKYKSSEKKLAQQLDDSEMKMNNLQVGLGQMNKLFAESSAVPDKPQYQKSKDGIILFWVDGMLWRRYHIYEAKGKNGAFRKMNKRSTKTAYYYIEDPKPGVWRYAITALDREGKETEKSEVLELKISP